ncbi:MEKHLA domain-containing protein [Haloferula chungangensis]|uniref:MEKHLA domain-containing protein n=1 Tax=Haloferula chungangensis TaxID=1048331 RepID=A0ABW2L2Z9_9BACT
MDHPSQVNRHQAAHAKLILESYRQLTGRELIPSGPDPAQRLFVAPIFVASHSSAEDPIFTYGNRTALDLFEMTWEEFISTPSRFTAEAPLRSERQRLLDQVAERGFIDDYSGIRVSKTGQRFEIQRATVWNLISATGKLVGQAATFKEWTPLEP